MKVRKLAAICAAIVACGSASAQEGQATTKEAIYPQGIVPIAPYSPGVMYGDLLFVSGQIPYVDGAIPEHANDGTNDVQDQTTIVMDNVSTVLEEAGMTLENALQVTVFLTDLSNYADFNSVYGPYWTDQGWTPPARAAVEVGALPGSSEGAPVLVEVAVIAGR